EGVRAVGVIGIKPYLRFVFVECVVDQYTAGAIVGHHGARHPGGAEGAVVDRPVRFEHRVVASYCTSGKHRKLFLAFVASQQGNLMAVVEPVGVVNQLVADGPVALGLLAYAISAARFRKPVYRCRRRGRGYGKLHQFTAYKVARLVVESGAFTATFDKPVGAFKREAIHQFQRYPPDDTVQQFIGCRSSKSHFVERVVIEADAAPLLEVAPHLVAEVTHVRYGKVAACCVAEQLVWIKSMVYGKVPPV